jgi:hypothetical protein
MAAAKLATLKPPPFQLSLRIKHPSIDPARDAFAHGGEQLYVKSRG